MSLLWLLVEVVDGVIWCCGKVLCVVWCHGYFVDRRHSRDVLMETSSTASFDWSMFWINIFGIDVVLVDVRCWFIVVGQSSLRDD